MSNEVDVLLANYGVEADDEFKHYGKKGMKWGFRKNGKEIGANKMARLNRRADRGDVRIAKAGSANRANMRIAGREAATQVLLSLGGTAASSLTKNPRVKTGISVVTGLVATGTMIKSINDIVDVNQSENRREG